MAVAPRPRVDRPGARPAAIPYGPAAGDQWSSGDPWAASLWPGSAGRWTHPRADRRRRATALLSADLNPVDLGGLIRSETAGRSSSGSLNRFDMADGVGCVPARSSALGLLAMGARTGGQRCRG